MKSKADLTLHNDREKQRHKVKQMRLKRPASADASKSVSRRTPTTLCRKDSLRRAGVRGRVPVVPDD